MIWVAHDTRRLLILWNVCRGSNCKHAIMSRGERSGNGGSRSVSSHVFALFLETQSREVPADTERNHFYEELAIN